MSPPHSFVPITLHLNIPPGLVGYAPQCFLGASQHTATGIYGWDVGLPSCARCPTLVHSMVIPKYHIYICQLHPHYPLVGWWTDQILCHKEHDRGWIPSQRRGNVGAPGIFCDPCPTGGILGGALRGAHLAQRSFLGVWMY